MGATASRSSPTTHLVTIRDYSKLARKPGDHQFSTIFRDLPWNVSVSPLIFKEGLADYFVVSVSIDQFLHRLDHSADGTDISIEILDETGEHTVFHEESSITRMLNESGSFAVNRRELEASSCIHNDSFTVRCTMKQETKRRLGNFSKSQKVEVLKPQVAMAGSHTLTIDSFSKLKAALRAGECIRSTHFAVGGCRWYLQLCPNACVPRPCLYLVRASKDETPTTAEFSFEFEGSMNFESQKMMHTFDPANYFRSDVFRYELFEASLFGDTFDHLVVRCRLAVMTVEKPSLPPAAISKTTPGTEYPSLPPAAISKTTPGTEYPSLSPVMIPTTIPDTESELTPLLSAMYG